MEREQWMQRKGVSGAGPSPEVLPRPQLRPVRLPAIVQAAWWAARPYGLLRYGSRGGEPFELRVSGLGRLAIVADPTSVRRAFHLDESSALGGEANRIMEPVVGSRSLFVLDGAAHTSLRSNIRSALRATDIASSLANLDQSVRSTVTTKATVPLFEWVHAASNRFILQVLFGSEWDDGRVTEIEQRLKTLLGPGISVLAFFPALRRDLGPMSPGRHLRRILTDIEELLESFFVSATPGSFSHRFAKSRDFTPVVRDTLLTLLAAGGDTTASAASTAIWYLALDPGLQRDVRVDIASGSEDLARSVVLEALRLAPPVETVPRLTIRDLELGDLAIPEDVYLSPCPFLSHRRADEWIDADRFDPRRWSSRPVPGSYFPFGGGNRQCPGQHTALAMATQFIVSLAGHAEVSVHGRGGQHRVRSVRRNVTVGPPSRIRVGFAEFDATRDSRSEPAS